MLLRPRGSLRIADRTRANFELDRVNASTPGTSFIFHAFLARTHEAKRESCGKIVLRARLQKIAAAA